MTKTIPRCPQCGDEMKITGTKNRGEATPVRIFQCMNITCRNPKQYNRKGGRIW